MQQDKRVQFDFEVEFLNGGGIQGQGFRLDIEGEQLQTRRSRTTSFATCAC